uniref:Protein kinase domain-containing protein n=1 Tax=Rhabditophanes sp. KR3021 TaxID=114890 RepID=A0AC35U2Z6_9BILA
MGHSNHKKGGPHHKGEYKQWKKSYKPLNKDNYVVEEVLGVGTVRYASRDSYNDILNMPHCDMESWIFSIIEIHDPEALLWR